MPFAPPLVRRSPVVALWFGAALLIASSGCQSLSIKDKLPWSKPEVKESEFQTPTRIVALWAEDVMTSQGKQPARGFGARIYFYNERNQTIPVEGQLVVYGFDDSQGDVSSRQPDRKFVFTAEQFAQHFGASDLGASYSVWIPWDPVGGPRKEISLIPVFTSSSGKVVVGPQTVSVLGGPEPPGGSKVGRRIQQNRGQQPAPGVAAVAHWESSGAAAPANPAELAAAPVDGASRGSSISLPYGPSTISAGAGAAAAPGPAPGTMRTSTIFVPESMSRRMAGEAPATFLAPALPPAPSSPPVAPQAPLAAPPPVGPLPARTTAPWAAPATARQLGVRSGPADFGANPSNAFAPAAAAAAGH